MAVRDRRNFVMDFFRPGVLITKQLSPRIHKPPCKTIKERCGLIVVLIIYKLCPLQRSRYKIKGAYVQKFPVYNNYVVKI